MKKITLGLIAALALAAPAFANEKIVGTWNVAPPDADGSLHVNIAPCGGAFCGTIAAAFDAAGQPSAEYEHLGKRLIWDMVPDGSGGYAGGRIWAPDEDKTYRSKMAFEGEILVVQGCVAGGLVCREGGRWDRVK